MLEALESHFGISQSLLQFLILFGAGALIIGTYWRTIVGGLIVIFIIYVFVHDSNESQIPKQGPPPQPVLAVETKSLKEKSINDGFHDEFMEDCMNIAANDKDQCEEIWRETEPTEDTHEEPSL